MKSLQSRGIKKAIRKRIKARQNSTTHSVAPCWYEVRVPKDHGDPKAIKVTVSPNKATRLYNGLGLK